MVSVTEIGHALYGSYRLARADRRGLAYLDRSLAGCRRSFIAAVLTLPAFYLLLFLHIGDAELERSGWQQILLVETIGDAISWTAFPLAVLPMLRWLGIADRWPGFITAYNWASVLQMGIQLVTNSIAGLIGDPSIGALIVMLGIIVALVYEWYVCKVALDITSLPATAIVLFDLVLGLAINSVTTSLY
ncbi:MAG TPA: hypothetical protein VNT30_08950 [Stellaceae bacterium]|nr:hypothetical protein [Stellaceae bacterium]